MTTRRDIVPESMKVIRERFHYNPGVLVGETLHIAGQVGRDENMNVVEGTEAQMTQAFENLKKVLTEAGATFDDIVDMTTYHVEMRDIGLFMKVKDRYFTNKVPAWTGVGVTCLAFPGLRVEIKCTAVLKT